MGYSQLTNGKIFRHAALHVLIQKPKIDLCGYMGKPTGIGCIAPWSIYWTWAHNIRVNEDCMGRRGRVLMYIDWKDSICLLFLFGMARKARIDATGTLHHIIVRGIERRKIFWDDADRDSFVNRLGKVLIETHTDCFRMGDDALFTFWCVSVLHWFPPSWEGFWLAMPSNSIAGMVECRSY